MIGVGDQVVVVVVAGKGPLGFDTLKKATTSHQRRPPKIFVFGVVPYRSFDSIAMFLFLCILCTTSLTVQESIKKRALIFITD